MPDWKSAIASRLSTLTLEAAREREIIDELSQHLNDRYDELRSGGASHDEAMRVAIDEINDEGLLAREMRTLRQSSVPPPIAPGSPPASLLADLRQDVIYALRTLGQRPGFLATAILTLALGIGANTAIFSLVNATLLQRLPVQNRERLVHVFNGPVGNVFSYPAYSALRDGTRLLDGIAAWGGIVASLNADGETDMVFGSIVTGRFFELLGVTAGHGRVLTRADDGTPGAHPVAVISHRLWRGRFGGRSDIVGHRVRLNGQTFEIVGVTRPEFPGAQLGVTRDLYVPMMMQTLMRPPRAGYSGEMNPDLLNNPGNGWLTVLGLLKPGVSPEQVRAELSALSEAFVRSVNPNQRLRPQPAAVLPIDEGDPDQRRRMRSVATLLGCVVGAVLLIACANVANLLLSKAAARRREIAVRLALGASRWRIVRQLLTESVILALMGGAAGLLLAWMVIQAFHATPPPAGALPIAIEFAIDRRVLMFSIALSVLTGVIFGIAPALQASRPGMVPALKDESSISDGRGRRVNIKKTLVVAEVALSVLLLIAAGLFIRSLRATQTIDPGIAADELISAPLNINLLRYTRAQGREFYQRVIEQAEQLPGVQAASVARVAVLSGGARTISIVVDARADSGRRFTSEGDTGGPGDDAALANVVGPGFFRTLGIPLVRGRDFDRQDIEGRPAVAVINETMASRFFPDQEAIGQRFNAGGGGPDGTWTEIVGIVRDSKYRSLAETPGPVVYLPLAQRHETGVTLYVRTAGAPAQLVAPLRQAIQSLEPNLPVPNIQTMTDTIGTSLYASRMGAMLLAVFGALALLLAALGVYGVLAFSMARRTREIGIRMALGADRGGVFSLVVREGLWLVGFGLAIGLLSGLYASAFIQGFLVGVSTHDVATFATVPVVLAAVALLACYLPARRATKVDPMVALRES